MILVENMTKRFGNHVLFDGFNMEILDGDFWVITGESGCGKTTLLNILGGIEPVNDGNVTCDSKVISSPEKMPKNFQGLRDYYKIRKNQLEYYKYTVGFLFQNFALVEAKTVRQNLELVQKTARTDIDFETALASVGMQDKLDCPVYTLSGGEQQRIALARLMVKKCNIILADEPTGSLDKANAKSVIDILRSMNQNGKTVCIVTHDESIGDYATKSLHLERKKDVL